MLMDMANRYLEKYVRYEDYCQQCTDDYGSGKKHSMSLPSPTKTYAENKKSTSGRAPPLSLVARNRSTVRTPSLRLEA